MSMEQRQRNGDLVEIPDAVVEFAESLPWRPVSSLKARLDGRDPCAPDDPFPCQHQRELFPGEPIVGPHWYVIRDWHQVKAGYWEFARIITALGYKGRYEWEGARRPMLNDYLEIGESFVYWAIKPTQLCRTKIAWHQHEVVPVDQGPEQLALDEP
jgi:hypothetical protein